MCEKSHPRAVASSSHGGQRRQPRVVPAAHVAALDQRLELALAHDRVRDVEPRVLPHQRLVQPQHLRSRAEPLTRSAFDHMTEAWLSKSRYRGRERTSRAVTGLTQAL